MPITDIILVSQDAYSPYDVLMHSSVIDINLVRGLTENTSIFDTVIHDYGIHLAESSTISDIVSRNVAVGRGLTEQTIIIGLLIEGRNLLRTLVESTIIYDINTEDTSYFRQFAETLPMVGVINLVLGTNRSVACYISNYRIMTATTVIKVRNKAVQIEY